MESPRAAGRSADDVATSERPPPAKTTRPDRGWRGSGRTLLYALGIALAVRVGIAQAYVIEGPSMEPTLHDGEHILVARCAYGLSLPGVDDAVVLWDLPEVGDVVIVQSPADGLDLVKRVVGLPGDIIELREDVVYRNGEPVERGGPSPCPGMPEDELTMCERFEERVGERTWTVSRSPLGAPETRRPVVVPPGHIYVLGDHRDRSNDSRAFGPIPMGRLRGRAVFVD